MTRSAPESYLLSYFPVTNWRPQSHHLTTYNDVFLEAYACTFNLTLYYRDDEQEAATIAPINPKPDGSLATFYDVAVPDEDEGNESTGDDFVPLLITQ